VYRQCATPVFLLASRKLDAYPEVGSGLTLGPDASPDLLVQSLEPATRLLVAVVNDADPEVRAVIFRRPEIIVAASLDFVPQGAMELSLHAHDMCTGLKVAFEPPAELCYRLREDTRPWPMWTVAWNGLCRTEDPWGDQLTSSGRQRQIEG